MRGKKAENAPLTKAELARRLNERALELAKAVDQEPLEIGQIVYEVQQDRALLTELGCGSVKEWGQKTFARSWKKYEAYARVYGYLIANCNLSREQIAEMGIVKAQLLARLPESEVSKPEWQAAAKEMSTADFKQKLKAHTDKSPDHRENYCRVSFDCPKSFRDETWKRVIALGLEQEETDEPYVVVEAALTNYEQEIQEPPAEFEETDVTETNSRQDAETTEEAGD